MTNGTLNLVCFFLWSGHSRWHWQ